MDNLFAYTNTAHALAAVIWVGGMAFAYFFLRPSLGFLEPPQRLTLWAAVFKRFFVWVWISVTVLPATGYAMVFFDFGGFAAAGHHVDVMHAIGWVMIALFVVLFFGPYQKFKAAVAAQAWPVAGASLNTIRRIIATNTALGLLTVIVGVSGRFWG